MGYPTVSPLREALGAVISLPPRNQPDRRFRHTSSIGWLVLLLPFAAMAGDISEALTTREAQRQLERQQRLQSRTPDARMGPALTRDEGRPPTGESPCFEISRIELVGDLAERFQWALAAADQPIPGETGSVSRRCLGAGGINWVMKRIQNAILARGYVTTRVLATPQDLNGGRLELTLIPGRIRAIRFAEGTDARATRWNAFPAKPGDLLNLRDLEQALENFERVPTVTADIQIVPAVDRDAGPGDSDLRISWTQRLPWRLNLFADDSGARSTGKYQGGVTFSYDHWWTLNDLFYLSFNHDLSGGDSGRHGTRGYSAHYSLPFGKWLLSFSGGKNTYYQSVPGPGLINIYSGESRTGEIKLTRLLYRDANSKTHAGLRGWLRASKNYINDLEVESQRRRMAGWELDLAMRQFIATATFDASLAYRRGTGAFGALRAPEDNFGEGTARPHLVTAETRWDQPFHLAGQPLHYTALWRAQWNATPLVPQDRFAIGGRHSVRGFDGEMILSGDRGWLIRNDLAIAIGQGQRLYLGIDHGEVGGPASAGLIGKRLSGAVLGLRGGYRGLAWDVFTGMPLAQPLGFQTAARVWGCNINWSI